MSRLRTFVTQATERAAELEAALADAQGGAPDWAHITATLVSLQRNLVSAGREAQALEPAPPEG